MCEGTLAALNGGVGSLGGKSHVGPGEGLGVQGPGALLAPGDNPPPPGSSLETLLLNILGLLKVAAQNARNWEQQVSAEKGKGCGHRCIAGAALAGNQLGASCIM